MFIPTHMLPVCPFGRVVDMTRNCSYSPLLTCPFDHVVDRADGAVVVNHVTCLSLPRHATGHRQLRGLGALPLCHTRGTAYVTTARAAHALTVSDVLRTVVARGRLTW